MPFFSIDPNETPETLEQKFLKLFEERGRSAEAWRAHAHALREAANTMWEGPLDHHQVAMMLDGLAIEALAKAVQIAQDPTLVSAGRWTLKSHDLESLVAEAGLVVDANQRSLLIRLTGFVTWAGRYPIPLKSKAMTPTMNASTKELSMPAGTWIADGDREAASKIFGRLERVLSNQRGAQPSS